MIPEDNYPRALIINNLFSEKSGSGIFLGRLFTNWPVSKLATICSGNLPPDWKKCRLHYRTGNLEFKLKAPFKWIFSNMASCSVLPSFEKTSIVNTAEKKVSDNTLRYQNIFRKFLHFLGNEELFYDVGPSIELLEWVQKFQPEVIYGICSSLNSLLFLRSMQQNLCIPLVLHFMDDWPASLYRHSLTAMMLRSRYLVQFSELICSSDVAVAICKEMAEEYQHRYQRVVLTLPMPVELPPYQALVRKKWIASKPFRIRYGGRVGWAIRDSLADISEAVRSLRQDGFDVVFDITTFQLEEVPKVCFSSNGVNVAIPGPLADLPRTQAEADVLIICYDFDQESFRQARYSMPSKMADCMASGTPILVYGPSNLPVVEYARRDGWGMVVDNRDAVALRGAIIELMGSAALREHLGKTAKRLASNIHDANKVSESFYEIMRGASDKHRVVL